MIEPDKDLMDALARIEARARTARKGFEEHRTINGRTALWDCESEARYARMGALRREQDKEAAKR